MGSSSLSLLVDDCRAGAKVDLDFKAWLDFDASERLGIF